MNTQTCIQCGNWFEQKHVNQLLCSEECVRLRIRGKQKESRKKLEQSGLCRECWHSPVVIGKKVCKTCLEKNASARKRKADADPRFCMFTNARHRANVYKIPFSIEIQDIVIPEYCPVFGLKLERGIGKIQDSSPTLDKINPKKGYVKGNIAVLSRKANRLKNDATLDELILLGKWAEKVKAR